MTTGSHRTPRDSGRTLVAVLTWKGEAVTRRCLDSLRGTSQWPNDVVIVDNASGTGEGDRLAHDYGVASVTTERNGGVAGGYNAAIARACVEGYEHVLLLNNDVRILRGDAVRVLSVAMHPGVAAVGPIVEEDSGLWSAGGRLRLALGHATHRKEPAGPEPYVADWIDGAAMLVSVDAARAIGGFADDYFLYWEETDWCTRARQSGWQILVEPRVRIFHERGATIPGIQTRRYALRNSLLFVRRNARGWRTVTASFLWLIVRVPVFLLRVGQSHGARAALAGAADAILWHAGDVRRRGFVPKTDATSPCPHARAARS